MPARAVGQGARPCPLRARRVRLSIRLGRGDNLVFARISRGLALDVADEAVNITSLDEVADSAWFENRIGAKPMTEAEQTLGACAPEDVLPDVVADGARTVDHGKDNGRISSRTPG